MTPRKKLIRITTVPMSFNLLLRGQLNFMSEHYDVLAVSSPGKELEEVKVREQVYTVPVAMTRSITPIKDIKALWQLYMLFRKEKPSIVHTHTPKAGLLGMIAATLAGVPLRMHTVAGLPLLKTSGLKRRMLNFTERCTYMCAHHVYANSFELRNMLLQSKFCRGEKLKVIGRGSSNGIDTSHFDTTTVSVQRKEELSKELGFTADMWVFCFSGRVVADKGINELIRAFLRLHNQNNSVRLLLVGWMEPELDPLEESIEQQIQQHEAIKWVGYQADIRPYLAISKTLVFPSHREGFPNVPMQAGAMGLPCIVSDINGCNEIIEHGKNGLVIPVKNEEAIFGAMKEMMENEELYRSLLPHCRAMIADRFSQQYVWDALLTEYRSFVRH